VLSGLKSISAATAKAKAFSAIRTFPSIIFSALVIGWAAEATQFLPSYGLASAILAWVQTLPEWREEITFVYILWIMIELLRAFSGRRKLKAFPQFKMLLFTYVLKKV
jgi:hypothetical protein